VALRDGWRRSRRSKIESSVRPAFIFRRARSMVGGRRRNPRARQGARCEDWTRRTELLFPDAGIVVRDRRIPPDTRLAGSTPCLIAGVHRDQHLALDLGALIRGFRAPALATVGWARGRRSKASQGGNCGEVGEAFGERAYGDLRIADGWQTRRRRRAALGVFAGSGGVGRFRWRRCAGARRWPRSQEGWRPRAAIGLVFRRAAGGGGDRRCAAGCGATVMSCRS